MYDDFYESAYKFLLLCLQAYIYIDNAYVSTNNDNDD